MTDNQNSLPSLSVIVPVYNVAQYLEECLDSLFEQTLNNIEIIFIEDCSTDRSLEILERYIREHPVTNKTVRIIKHDENKGVAYSREEGVKSAKGEWIIHCDADDIPDRDMYETLYSKALEKEADMVVCSYKQFGVGIKEINRHQGSGKIPTQEMLGRIAGSATPPLHGALWNKLIKRDLYSRVKFPENVSFCEDVAVLFQILIQNPSIHIEILPEMLYKYRIREGSLVKKNDQQRIGELERLIIFMESLGDNEGNIVADALAAKIITLIYRIFLNGGLNKENLKKYQSYQTKIDYNKELMKLEKLSLSNALKGNLYIAQLISSGVVAAKRVFKVLKKL